MTIILSQDVTLHILTFIEPSHDLSQMSYDDLKAYARPVVNMSLVNKEFHSFYSKKLSEIKDAAVARKVKDFENRYPNPSVLSLSDLPTSSDRLELLPAPLQKLHHMLFDALRSQGRFRDRFKDIRYRHLPKTIKDIKEIIRLILSCIDHLESSRGQTPLCIACIDPSTPTEVISLLLEQGEKPCRVWKSRFLGGSYNQVRYFFDATQIERETWFAERPIFHKAVVNPTSLNCQTCTRIFSFSWKASQFYEKLPQAISQMEEEICVIQSERIERKDFFEKMKRAFFKYEKPCLPAFSTMPLSVKERILSFLVPSKIDPEMTCKKIKGYARDLMRVTLVDKDLAMIARVTHLFYDLKRACSMRETQDLRQKYSKYDSPPYLEEYPYLLDALCTGCQLPFTQHTVEDYTAQTERDIKRLLVDKPSRKSEVSKVLMTSRRISILGAACVNPNVSLRIVEIILDNFLNSGILWHSGRLWHFDTDKHVNFGYSSISTEFLMSDLKGLRPYLEKTRFKQLKHLFWIWEVNLPYRRFEEKCFEKKF